MGGPWERFATGDSDGPWTKFSADNKPAEPAPSDGGSYGVDLARTIAQGASMGTSDEIVAAARSVRPYSGGVGPGRSAAPVKAADSAEGAAAYDTALKEERQGVKRFAEKNPVTALAAQIGGGLVTAPLLPVAGATTVGGRLAAGMATGAGYGATAGFAAGEGGIGNRVEAALQGGAAGAALGSVIAGAGEAGRSVRRAYANQGRSGAYGSIVDDLPQGVDTLADEIATGASRNNITTNRRTFDLLGEEMERHGGDVQAAQQATIARIVAETGATPSAAAAQIRRLSNVHEGSNLFLGEYPAISQSDAAQRLRAPGNVNLDDLGRTQQSTTQATLDYLGNNGNAQSAQNVRNAVTERQEALAPAMRSALEEIGPRIQTAPRTFRPADIVDTEGMINQARAMANQDYTAAYNSPVANPQRLQQLPRLFEYFANRAATSAPEVAATIRNAVNQVAVRRPDGSLGVQGLRQMQQGRTTIRGQMQALAQSGRADLAREVRPLYDILTRTMEDMSPAWASANRRWADMNFDVMAQDLGDAFATKAGPQFRQQIREFRALAPEAQNIVRVHFLQKLYDKLDNLGDTHSVSKLFSNDHSRNMIREMFGDPAAVSFTRAVRDQKVAEASQRAMGNSATHRRGVAQKQKDAETGLVAAVENANARGMKNWLLERMTQMLTERRNRPMGDILTTPMSDIAQVARHVHNMRRQQQVLQGLDNNPPQTGRAIQVLSGTAGNRMGRE